MLLKYTTEFKVPLKLPLNVLKWLFSSIVSYKIFVLPLHKLLLATEQ